jgi:hypothetical protein
VSRLDINIGRLEAQRACLNFAAEAIRDLPGPVLELGLGNGRTYDHLRELMPAREIFVFERDVAAHPDCIPDEDYLFRGDFRDTLAGAGERFGGRVAMVHADFGFANIEQDARLPAFVAGRLPGLLRPGGIVASDRDVEFEAARHLALPEGLVPGVYYLFQRPLA